jgi:hypothetical protein
MADQLAKKSTALGQYFTASFQSVLLGATAMHSHTKAIASARFACSDKVAGM